MELSGRLTIGRYIALLSRMATVYLGQELKHLNIGPGQYIFLAELFDEEGLSQDELTQRTHVDKSNTTRALKRLEQAGYIERRSDDADKRIKRVFLQPAAREIEQEFWRILTNWSAILGENLQQEQQERILQDLHALADNALTHLRRH